MPLSCLRAPLLAGLLLVLATPAFAATGEEAAIGLIWAVPFAGLLLSIALGPLIAERVWHHRMGMIAAGWSLLLLLPWAVLQGPGSAFHLAWHAFLLEYLPFISLIFALFTVGGGIVVQGGPWGSPAGNTLLLAIGTGLASLMGTTGAAMVLIHPLLRANAHRTRKVHLAVFFILLVGNVGGSLTPLGDPPLFLGFLRGVPFGWPAANMLAPMLVMAGILLATFYVMDRRLAAGDPPPEDRTPLRVVGIANIGLLVLVIADVLMGGLWKPGKVPVLGIEIGMQELISIAVLFGLGLLSLRITPGSSHAANMFSWGPLEEVAKLFIAIFIVMAPVIGMLDQGVDGPFAWLVHLVDRPDGTHRPAAYFWITGALSAFLDNAPTYVVFFELAGGEVPALIGEHVRTLLAISCGAVFMGALTYIGNAPNFMIRAIASRRGVHMPGFIGFMGWSFALMIPPLLVVTVLFFL